LDRAGLTVNVFWLPAKKRNIQAWYGLKTWKVYNPALRTRTLFTSVENFWHQGNVTLHMRKYSCQGNLLRKICPCLTAGIKFRNIHGDILWQSCQIGHKFAR
jgi:hypothetical protein